MARTDVSPPVEPAEWNPSAAPPEDVPVEPLQPRDRYIPPKDVVRTIEEDEYHKVTEIDYFGRTIRIIHMEHEPSVTDSTGREHWAGGECPDDWVDILDDYIMNSSLVFLEYAPWEIDRENRIPYARQVALEHMEAYIEEFFARAAALASSHGIDVAVSDVAYRLGWEAERQIDEWRHDIRRNVNPHFRGLSYFGHRTEVDPREFEIRTANDARRLFTAFGIMEEALRYKEGSVLTYIAPPAHAKRVEAYIARDLDTEHPEDRQTDGKKMKGYLALWPFTRRNVTTRIYTCPASVDEIETALTAWDLYYLLKRYNDLEESEEYVAGPPGYMEERERELAEIIERYDRLLPVLGEMLDTLERHAEEKRRPDGTTILKAAGSVRLSIDEIRNVRKLIDDYFNDPDSEKFRNFNSALRLLTGYDGWVRRSNLPIRQPKHPGE